MSIRERINFKTSGLRPAATPAASIRPSTLERTLLLCASIIAVAAVLAVFVAVWALGGANRGNEPAGYTGIASDRYQAVFLSNGQVYFGKLSDAGPELVRLQDIWYLQVQPGAQSTAADTLKNQESQISLAKLGNELHGPDDSMSISKQQILFWENVKDDSKVVEAISKAKL